MNPLARTCLRLAAVAALRNATIAGDRLFDSRIGQLERLTPERCEPVITVFTEDQSGDALSSQNGGPPFKGKVDLVLEIAMAIRGLEDDVPVLLYPATSDDLELSLDVLEAQTRVALFESMAVASRAFRLAFVHALSASSIRFTNDGAQERVAIRYVTYSLEVKDDLLVSFDTEAVGLARLPPTFRDVAVHWPDDSPERERALLIADSLAQPAAPLLTAMRVNPPDDPSPTGPAENWTPPTEPPPQAGGLTPSADWSLGE